MGAGFKHTEVLGIAFQSTHVWGAILKKCIEKQVLALALRVAGVGAECRSSSRHQLSWLVGEEGEMCDVGDPMTPSEVELKADVPCDVFHISMW